MKKTAMLLALACAVSAPRLVAQTIAADAPPVRANHMQEMVQHRVDYMTTVLSLTAAQQTQIKNVLTTAAANESSTHASMRAAHEALTTAARSNDAASMEQSANTIGTLVAQEALAHAKKDAAIYQALTPEQQTKMVQLESVSHHGGHGFGGPGPGF